MPAVYLARQVSFAAVARTFDAFRLMDRTPAVPAIALGAIDTSLLALTSAYAALANGGIYVSPRLFVSVQDREGNDLLTGEIAQQRVAGEDAVFVLTNILRGVLERGTGKSIRALGFTGPAAGKTGTSDQTRDAWFVGYTPDLAVGVWTESNDNSKLGLTGAAAAAPIWADLP